MKAKLIVEGREFPIEIQDPELKKLLKPQKKTGYERKPIGEVYFYVVDADVCSMSEGACFCDKTSYEVANYYSDITIAENNTRADTLMRKLRRFAVEHRENKIEWCNHKPSSFIFYNHRTNELKVAGNDAYQACGVVYFDSEKTAELAIEEFKDELIWYFTEYKDSL